MYRLVVFSIALLSAVAVAAPAQAQGSSVFTWICNIEGAPAQLTAQVEAVNGAGVFVDPNGMFAGSVSLDEVTYYYEGTLVSASSRYTFVGENQFADFVDLQTNDRFRVQMIMQNQYLQMIVNPFGQQPAQYMCQMSQ
jgi:hypothetical protein